MRRRRARWSIARRAIADDLDTDFLELRNRHPLCPSWPQQDLYVTFRKEISADAEVNMQAIPRKQRAMVRKGIKNGLRSVVDDGVERFFALYADNMHRHGTPPYGKAYFERLRSVFGPQCEAMIVTDAGGTPVSGVLSFYFRDEVLPYYAGDTLAARDLAANDFKYWELMRRACERGLRVFDYGRSKRGTGTLRLQEELGVRAGAAALRVPAAQARHGAAEQSPQSQIPRAGGGVAPASAAGGQRARAAHRPQSRIACVPPQTWMRCRTSTTRRVPRCPVRIRRRSPGL